MAGRLMGDWGQYTEFYKTFCVKRFNDLCERRKAYPELTEILTQKIQEIKDYCYKMWFMELKDSTEKISERENKEMYLFDFMGA